MGFNCIPGMSDPIFGNVGGDLCDQAWGVITQAGMLVKAIVLEMFKYILDMFDDMLSTLGLVEDLIDNIKNAEIPFTPGITVWEVLTLDTESMSAKVDAAYADPDGWRWEDIPFLFPFYGLVAAGVELAANMQAMITHAIKSIYEMIMTVWNTINDAINAAMIALNGGTFNIKDLLVAILDGLGFPNIFDMDFDAMFQSLWDMIPDPVEVLEEWLEMVKDAILDFEIFGISIRDILGLPDPLTPGIDSDGFDLATIVREAFVGIMMIPINALGAAIDAMVGLIEALGMALPGIEEIKALVAALGGTISQIITDIIRAYGLYPCEEGEAWFTLD